MDDELKLNQHTLFDGQLTARGARDRFTLLSKKMKVQNTKELKTTGGAWGTRTNRVGIIGGGDNGVE